MSLKIMVDAYSSPRIVKVLDATEITIQNLYNAIREWEHEPAYLSYLYLTKGAGKQDLGGGSFVGITMTLLNAKIRFEDQVSWTTCYVKGGNLVAVDTYGVAMVPIEPAAYVNVVIAQSASPTIASSDITAIGDEVVSRGVLLEDDFLQLK